LAADTETGSISRRSIALTMAVATGGLLAAILVRDEHLLALSLPQFLPLNLISGLFAVLVCFAVFAVGWYTPRQEADPQVRVLSAVFLGVGLLYVLHLLTFPGMPVVVAEPSFNRAMLFQTCARLVASVGLLLVALVPPDRLRGLPGAVLYPGAVALPVLATWLIGWHEAWLPAMYVPVLGPTQASDWAQVVTLAIEVPAAVLFYRDCRRSPGCPASYFIQALIFLIFGGLAYILYQDIFGLYNLLARFYRIVGYFFIFQGAYVTNVRRPYQELERALAELLAVDQLKDEFVSGLTHDLRQPLVPALGFLDIVLSGRTGPLTPKQGEYLRHCRGSVERQSQLIDELRDYFQLRSGRLDLHLEPLDLREVLREALAGIEPLAAQEGLSLEADLGEAALPVTADRAKMRRVFGNLLSNAVKFNRPHGLVRVEARRGDAQVAVSVADTGRGILPEERERVFERFYQGRQSHGNGSGIGLWVVREITHLHGGHVELTSEPGRGSRFTVYLDQDRPEAH
jgi:signal transduction histidine kinase